ncbi:hypothetical protein CR513_03237, partial [Mucuna pruriens]
MSRLGHTNSFLDWPTLQSNSPIRSNPMHCPRKATQLRCQQNLEPAQLPCHSEEASSTSYTRTYLHIHHGPFSRAHSSSSRWCTVPLMRRSSTERLKVVRGDRLACHRTLVDLILNTLANIGEPSPFNHDDQQMENNNDRTLKELATPNMYPQLEPAQTYELKSSLIHLLPKFHGLAGEDPHKHLKEFHMVCSTMRPQGIPEDYIKMKALSFSLDGATIDWLYL